MVPLQQIHFFTKGSFLCRSATKLYGIVPTWVHNAHAESVYGTNFLSGADLFVRICSPFKKCAYFLNPYGSRMHSFLGIDFYVIYRCQGEIIVILLDNIKVCLCPEKRGNIIGRTIRSYHWSSQKHTHSKSHHCLDATVGRQTNTTSPSQMTSLK